MHTFGHIWVEDFKLHFYFAAGDSVRQTHWNIVEVTDAAVPCQKTTKNSLQISVSVSDHTSFFTHEVHSTDFTCQSQFASDTAHRTACGNSWKIVVEEFVWSQIELGHCCFFGTLASAD